MAPGVCVDTWIRRAGEFSVPLRGFRGLQDSSRLHGAIAAGVFQSPCGVLGVCRDMIAAQSFQVVMFQSPCGVLGVCREAGQVG